MTKPMANKIKETSSNQKKFDWIDLFTSIYTEKKDPTTKELIF